MALNCLRRREGHAKMAWLHASFYVWGLFVVTLVFTAIGVDNNNVYKPCQDTTVGRDEGFTFGLAFSANSSFYNKNGQLSPCNKHLSSILQGAQVAAFRPKVDEISLLVINISTFNPEYRGGYGVAYAGSHYAIVSQPVFLANGSDHVTSLSLVMHFDEGRLVNLLWKNDKCASCRGRNTTFVCLNSQQCTTKSSLCKGETKSKVDCSFTIQLTFSGTDKYQDTLNSWYQLKKVQQYSLFPSTTA